MATDNPTRLFEHWEDVDNDAQYIYAAMADLGFLCEYADLSLSDQQLTLAVALMKKRAHHMTYIGQA